MGSPHARDRHENYVSIVLYRNALAQECKARKVNCGCVYSVYILKPVLSGRNL